MSGPRYPLDEAAIRNPARFLSHECGMHWLPSHGQAGPAGTISVRDRYELALPPEEKLSIKGMRALLDLRATITKHLVAVTTAQTERYCQQLRGRLAEQAGFSAEERAAFIAAGRPVECKIPGSNEPTSDLDITTQGDCTEYFVQAFNTLFRELHDGIDSGIFFDVNVYAKNFLPDFKIDSHQLIRIVDPISNRPADKTFVRPNFEYSFFDYQSEQSDARSQLIHAFSKLRLWMEASEYRRFGDLLSMNDLLEKGQKQYLEYNHLLYQCVITQQVPQHLEKPPTTERLAAAEVHIRGVGSRTLIRSQNRLYEFLLRTRVEVDRGAFDLLLFKKDSSPDQLDAAFMKLRDSMSRSLYFANDAYITGGAILHVVGGKQMTSRGVLERGNVLFHNIAFTAHELIQSAVEQLADIYKIAGRCFRAQKPLGVVLLACGKYIHRLFNSMKHFYIIFSRAQNSPLEFPRCYDSFEHWNNARKLGFGLEALKKSKSAEDLRSILQNKFLIDDLELKSMEAPDSPEPAQKADLTEALVKRSLLTIRSLFKDSAAHELRIHDQRSFFDYFATIVAHALLDYDEYMKIPESLLQLRFERQHPPYFLPEHHGVRVP